MKATVITIGDEILIGQIVDTNAAYISRQLNAVGITVSERISIGDDAEQIRSTVDKALAASSVVVLTGGLGPTKDDITKNVLAEYFGGGMHYDTAVGDHVQKMLALRGIDFSELNRGQAMVPDKCTVLFNDHGTAPGMMFERDGKLLFSLPGVPFEMRHLIDERVLPQLKQHFTLRQIVHRTMITSGIAESTLAARIAAWEDSLPAVLHLAYLPAPNIVRLRLSAYDVDGEEATQLINSKFDELSHIIPQNIVGFENASVQELAHDIMVKGGLRLAVAESCTGGAVASRFTAMAGASAYFMLGAVTYSNESKRDVLGVNYDDIMREGAVSQTVAQQMAEGARRAGAADYAVSTTGIAGPTGGTADKPVGTVWFGVATPTHSYAVMKNCGTDRGQVIERAAAYAVELLYKELLLLK